MRLRFLVTLVAAGLVASTTASAQVNMKMGGEWWSNRGPLIDIPLQGGAEFRNPFVNGKPCFLQTGCLASFKQIEGGVPAPYTVGGASAVVTTNGTAPATFNIPVGAFSVNSAMSGNTALLPIVPTVIQLQSNFQALAPGSAGITAMDIFTTMGAPRTQILNGETSFMASRLVLSGSALVPTPTTIMGALAQPRRLRADAWTTQTGRLSPDFAFCQGGATGLEITGNIHKVGGVVNCTTPNVTNDPAQGPYGKAFNGIVSYTGGANRFGGTMMMLLDGGGTVAVKVDAPLPRTPRPRRPSRAPRTRSASADRSGRRRGPPQPDDGCGLCVPDLGVPPGWPLLPRLSARIDHDHAARPAASAGHPDLPDAGPRHRDGRPQPDPAGPEHQHRLPVHHGHGRGLRDQRPDGSLHGHGQPQHQHG
ncbi:MAG: hypothetical protein R3E53_16745 [Myxococcota bacterium]